MGALYCYYHLFSQNFTGQRDTSSSCNHQKNLSGVSYDDPPSNNSIPIPGNINQQSDVDLACLCHEGKVKLFNYLIKFAYSLDKQDNNDKPPYKHDLDPSKVCEWQYRDIMQIKDKNLCSEFECACLDELETLWKRNMFEKINRYSIKKQPIKCQWIFDIKPNGQKKVYLVAKGFSQCASTDYTDIYSPVMNHLSED